MKLHAWLVAVVMGFCQLSWIQKAHAATPVVIELFTSQGCSSCPPADKLVGALADTNGILVLSFHVDYWNNLGWKDPYSKPVFTQRQREYAQYLGAGNVYTPQAVVQGKYDVVGSNEQRLNAAIDATRTHKNWIEVALSQDQENISITLAKTSELDANIVLVGFDKRSSNAVPSGENAGEQLTHRNSVTELSLIGRWNGALWNKAFLKPKGDGVAVLIQSRATGEILGAGWL